jgi:DNA-binding MarR family transcriptional regulator
METLKHLLTSLYLNIMRLEEQALRKNERIELSLNEMLLIQNVHEAVDAECTVGSLAEQLNISRPSATVAVNKLEKRGFLRKVSHQSDGRVVLVRLTEEGEKINAFLRFYQRYIVSELKDEFTDEEEECLIRAIRKLSDIVSKNINQEGKKK